MLECLGYLATLLLVISAIPQVFKSAYEKNVEGISALMLWLWFLGCICMFIYVFLTTAAIPLLLNYGITIACTGYLIILYRKYKK